MSRSTADHPTDTTSAPEGARRIPPATRVDLEAYCAPGAELLIALDFDGTLAPFDPDPFAVRPVEGVAEALRGLVAHPRTEVMVISGRCLDHLRPVLLDVDGLRPADSAADNAAAGAAAGAADGQPLADAGLVLVGSHGAEPATHAGGLQLSDAQRAAWEQLLEAAESIAATVPGLWVERKPAAVGLHSRGCDAPAEEIAAAERAYEERAQGIDGVSVNFGKHIVEAAVLHASKGEYLASYRRPEQRVLFIGDDVTDETVLSTLQEGDLGIKVGDGETAARRRLPDQHAVADYLHELLAVLGDAE